MKYTWCVNDYWIAPPYPDELISTTKSQQRGRTVNKLDGKELQYLSRRMGWRQRGRRQGHTSKHVYVFVKPGKDVKTKLQVKP